MSGIPLNLIVREEIGIPFQRRRDPVKLIVLDSSDDSMDFDNDNVKRKIFNDDDEISMISNDDGYDGKYSENEDYDEDGSTLNNSKPIVTHVLYIPPPPLEMSALDLSIPKDTLEQPVTGPDNLYNNASSSFNGCNQELANYISNFNEEDFKSLKLTRSNSCSSYTSSNDSSSSSSSSNTNSNQESCNTTIEELQTLNNVSPTNNTTSPEKIIDIDQTVICMDNNEIVENEYQQQQMVIQSEISKEELLKKQNDTKTIEFERFLSQELKELLEDSESSSTIDLNPNKQNNQHNYDETHEEVQPLIIALNQNASSVIDYPLSNGVTISVEINDDMDNNQNQNTNEYSSTSSSNVLPVAMTTTLISSPLSPPTTLHELTPVDNSTNTDLSKVITEAFLSSHQNSDYCGEIEVEPVVRAYQYHVEQPLVTNISSESSECFGFDEVTIENNNMYRKTDPRLYVDTNRRSKNIKKLLHDPKKLTSILKKNYKSDGKKCVSSDIKKKRGRKPKKSPESKLRLCNLLDKYNGENDGLEYNNRLIDTWMKCKTLLKHNLFDNEKCDKYPLLYKNLTKNYSLRRWLFCKRDSDNFKWAQKRFLENGKILNFDKRLNSAYLYNTEVKFIHVKIPFKKWFMFYELLKKTKSVVWLNHWCLTVENNEHSRHLIGVIYYKKLNEFFSNFRKYMFPTECVTPDYLEYEKSLIMDPITQPFRLINTVSYISNIQSTPNFDNGRFLFEYFRESDLDLLKQDYLDEHPTALGNSYHYYINEPVMPFFGFYVALHMKNGSRDYFRQYGQTWRKDNNYDGLTPIIPFDRLILPIKYHFEITVHNEDNDLQMNTLKIKNMVFISKKITVELDSKKEWNKYQLTHFNNFPLILNTDFN